MLTKSKGEHMGNAFALACRELEKDPAPAESVLVDCRACDPDNPKAVPRDKCRACRGSGKMPTDLGPIVGEIHSSRLELLRGGRHDEED